MDCLAHTLLCAACPTGDLMSVSNNSTGAACPLSPHSLPSVTPGAAGSMLQLLLDDAFLNCVSCVAPRWSTRCTRTLELTFRVRVARSWVATTNGAMAVTLTNANLPPQFPLRLNTSDWAQLIPALAAKYPDRPMQVSC